MLRDSSAGDERGENAINDAVSNTTAKGILVLVMVGSKTVVEISRVKKLVFLFPHRHLPAAAETAKPIPLATDTVGEILSHRISAINSITHRTAPKFLANNRLVTLPKTPATSEEH